MAEAEEEGSLNPPKKKRSLSERHLSEDYLTREEPPCKRFRLDTEDLVEPKDLPVSPYKDNNGKHLKDRRDVSVSTPLKTVDSSKSLTSISSSLQSPDSAYDSSFEKTSPWSKVHSVDSSGIGSVLGTPSCAEEKDNIEQISSFPANNSNRLVDFLLVKFSFLKDEIEPKCLSSHLHDHGIITYKQMEDIHEVGPRRKGCDMLVKTLIKSPKIRRPLMEHKVKKAFDAASCLFLLKDLEKEVEHKPPVLSFKTFEVYLKLKNHKTEIEDTIEPKDIIDDLLSSGMMSVHDHTDIMDMDRRPRRLESLIEIINKQPRINYPKFCDAIEAHYPDLWKKLVQTESSHSTVKQDDVTMNANVSMSVRNKTSISAGLREDSTQVKLIMGNEEIESMIIEEYDKHSQGSLDMECMETGMMIEKMELSCIKISLKHLSPMAQLRFYNKCIKSKDFLGKWVINMMTEDIRLKAKERNISNIKFEIVIKKPTQAVCLCKLTSQDIVQNFTELEKSLRQVDRLLDVFAHFPAFKQETRVEFQALRMLEDQKTEMFLRKILEVEDIAVCLLEREMMNTEQDELLRLVTCRMKDTSPGKVTTKAFKKSFSFLMEEIEPRKYTSFLKTVPPRVLESVMSDERRTIRCKKFLTYIEKEGQTAVDAFVQALELEKETYILDVLGFEQDAVMDVKEMGRLVDSICQKIVEISEEVDPASLRQVFVERKAIKAKDFDMLCQQPTRKGKITGILRHILCKVAGTITCLTEATAERKNQLMRKLFIERNVMGGTEFDGLLGLPSHKKVFDNELENLQRQDTLALDSFMYALKTKGYESLAEKINKDKDAYKPCPRLELAGNHLFIKGSITLSYMTEPDKPFEVDKTNTMHCVNKAEFTKKWLNTQRPFTPQQFARQPYNRPASVSDEALFDVKGLFEDHDCRSRSSTNGSLYRRHDEGIDGLSSSLGDSPKSSCSTSSISPTSSFETSAVPSPASEIPRTPSPMSLYIAIDSFDLDHLK